MPANAYLLGRFSVRGMYFFCMAAFAVGCAASFAAPAFPGVHLGFIGCFCITIVIAAIILVFTRRQ